MLSGFCPITEEGVNFWQEGIAAYTSQIQYLFRNMMRMRRKVKCFWRKKRGIFLYNEKRWGPQLMG
jgi:hypothetical protein